MLPYLPATINAAQLHAATWRRTAAQSKVQERCQTQGPTPQSWGKAFERAVAARSQTNRGRHYVHQAGYCGERHEMRIHEAHPHSIAAANYDVVTR